MPCFTREKDLSLRPRRDKANAKDMNAPKPVRPRAMRYHGLFGMSIASQHLIVDEKWSPSSLTEQFVGFTELLKRRLIYKRHEIEANRMRLTNASKRLKSQCIDGRIKLQKISTGNNAQKVHNMLINHKDMQRLYQSMPIDLVVDNINQRTFVLRKERDRMVSRLDHIKKEYKKLLLERDEVEKRIKYEDEYKLEEELISRVLLKKIENSNVRLKAIQTINTTYKKMVQVLLSDEIFYEPILRSLDGDMEDQANFIKNILHLGSPAVAKFKVLKLEYLMHERKTQKNHKAKMDLLASLRKPPIVAVPVPVPEKPFRETTTEAEAHYTQETRSMTALKNQLTAVEKIIKELKTVTLCSQAKEIYPRVKGELENNSNLQRKIENDLQTHQMLRNKMSYATLFESVLVNNLSEEEINRIERIRELKIHLSKDEEFEEETLAQMKNRADAYVILRISIWNIVDILRHVERQPRTFRCEYPNSYLKLPLLKFDLLNVFAAPPELYEEDIDKVMHLVKRKVYKLMMAYKGKIGAENIPAYREKYHAGFLATRYKTIEISEDQANAGTAIEDVHSKDLASILNRKQIKAQSAKLVEEMVKARDT